MLAVIMSSWSHKLSAHQRTTLNSVYHHRRTEVNDVHAPLLKLVHAPSSRLLAAVVRIVNDDLSALDREEVPDLVFELVFDPSAQCSRRF